MQLRKASCSLALLFSTVFVVREEGQSSAPPGSLDAVLSSMRMHGKNADSRAKGRLVQVPPSGSRVNNEINLRIHSFPDGLKTMIVVTTPAHTQTSYLVDQQQSGRTSIQEKTSAETSPAKLAVGHWSEGVAGTFFSAEDFANGQFFWTKQTLLAPQKYGIRNCFVLKSEPGAEQPTQYSSVTTWIDQKTGSPAYVEAVPKGAGPKRQFIFFAPQLVEGVWVSRQVEARIEGTPGSTILLIERGSPHAHLQRKDFNLTAPVSDQ